MTRSEETAIENLRDGLRGLLLVPGEPGYAEAFPHRNADYNVHIFPGWSDPADDEDMMRWARELHEALAPHATGGTYVNLLDGDEDDPQAAAYAGNVERLPEVKGEWDPENVFHLNHSVEPAV